MQYIISFCALNQLLLSFAIDLVGYLA